MSLGARRSPDRVAVKMREGREVTYAELDRRTDRLANALLGMGLGPGDRVGAWLPDCVEYVELYLAVAKAGLVMVPVNARLRAGEASYPLVDSGAKVLFFGPDLAGDVGEIECLEALELVSVAHADGGVPARDFEALMAAGSAGPPPTPEPEDLFIIGYTSGTTGRPKGAMLTHRSVLAIARLNAISYHLPFFGTAALTGSMSFVATVPAHIFTHLLLGGTLVIMGSWDVETLIDVIERERATFTYIPSPLIGEFVEAARRTPQRWRSLQSVLHSASRASPEKLRLLAEVVGARFVEGLGMTENSGGLITATTRGDIEGEPDANDLFASVGRAVAESAVALVEPESGEPLPHDGSTVGELAIKSPALMSGYWNLPEASAAALVDGWYRSGDLGSIDPAGYVYIAERRTDLIVSGGMNVYPTEVEAFIRTLPGVADVAVVGLPHERWGQSVSAAVIPRPGAELTAEAVIESCRAGLASYKKPTSIRFLGDFPRTASMKVKRAEIRRQLEAEDDVLGD
ncbi:MAG: AMP-binding protein [Actinobacteria bacterium]|nr:AMP-binding protein [Actinomycetota bacterium]